MNIWNKKEKKEQLHNLKKSLLSLKFLFFPFLLYSVSVDRSPNFLFFMQWKYLNNKRRSTSLFPFSRSFLVLFFCLFFFSWFFSSSFLSSLILIDIFLFLIYLFSYYFFSAIFFCFIFFICFFSSCFLFPVLFSFFYRSFSSSLFITFLFRLMLQEALKQLKNKFKNFQKIN